MSIKSFIFSLLALCTLPTFAVISEMEVWGDGTNRLYLLKDVHTDYLGGHVTTQQQADILWTAQQLFETDGVCVLAEDILHYGGSDKTIKTCFEQAIPKTLKDLAQAIQKWISINEPNTTKTFLYTPLTGLIRACRMERIPVYNTECDHAWFIIHTIPNQKLTTTQMIKDLATHIAEIANNPEFQEEHAYFVRELEALKKLGSHNKIDKEFKDKFSHIRSCLVETKTIHMISKLRNTKHVLVCEGAYHIEQIKSALKSLKYEQLETLRNTGMPTITKPQTQKEAAEITQKALENPLNLKEIFKGIIAKQQQLKKPKVFPPASVAHAFKTGMEDALFLDSSHGQKHLAETAMNDDNQSAAAPAAPSPMLIQSMASTAMSDK